MLLADYQIENLCKGGFHHWETSELVSMVEPFYPDTSDGGVISYGLDHAGYCARLDTHIKLFKNSWGEHIDPKLFKDQNYQKRMFDEFDLEPHQYFAIPPHSYILAQTVEYFRIPRWLKGRVVGKSTYARCCVFANLTPLEPEWEGKITLEIGNVGPSPARVWIHEGIVQVEFEKLDEPCRRSYYDKKGKYQKQTSVTPAKA